MLQQRRQVVTWGAYVTDGLVAYYRGDNNTGFGHSADTALWKDLIDGADLTLSPGLKPGTRQWGRNYFESLKVNPDPYSWLSAPLPAGFSPENCTLEVVFMPYAGASGTDGGDVIGCDDVPSAPYTTITLEMAGLNGSFLMEEKSTFVSLNKKLLTANTMYTASMPVSPFSPVAGQNGSKAIWYNGVRNYVAARISNLFVQLPEHTINMGGNPALPSVAQNYYGRIFEARVYSRALTAAEITHNAALDRKNYRF